MNTNRSLKSQYPPQSKHSIYEATLPSMAVDNSELILGSIIERVSDSWDLYLTTFMISHSMLDPVISGTVTFI